MRSDKYNAVAQIVCAIINKKGTPESGVRPGAPGSKAEGLTVRFEEGRVFLYDAEEKSMTLEELIQYVDRYLG